MAGDIARAECIAAESVTKDVHGVPAFWVKRHVKLCFESRVFQWKESITRQCIVGFYVIDRIVTNRTIFFNKVRNFEAEGTQAEWFPKNNFAIVVGDRIGCVRVLPVQIAEDRKSTRLNSSHVAI